MTDFQGAEQIPSHHQVPRTHLVGSCGAAELAQQRGQPAPPERSQLEQMEIAGDAAWLGESGIKASQDAASVRRRNDSSVVVSITSTLAARADREDTREEHSRARTVVQNTGSRRKS